MLQVLERVDRAYEETPGFFAATEKAINQAEDFVGWGTEVNDVAWRVAAPRQRRSGLAAAISMVIRKGWADKKTFEKVVHRSAILADAYIFLQRMSYGRTYLVE